MDIADNVTFGGGGLDRQSHRRGDSGLMLADPATRMLGFWRGRPLITGDRASGRAAPVLLPADHALFAHASELRVFLGAASGRAIFGADLSGWNPESTTAFDAGPGRAGDDMLAPPLPDLPGDARFADMRGLLAVLDPLGAEIAATAKGILEWHRAHRFCANCGAPTAPIAGGWQRGCPECGKPHFPRTDPVVIMLVTHGNSLLLGRSPGWPEGMYSLLAGFMEPGETISMAVRREVAEETGVPVAAVRALASQPWPWPTTLMIGCTAQAMARDITLDRTELDDAIWVTREDLADIFAARHPTIRPARKGAIAHFLMQLWLADRLE